MLTGLETESFVLWYKTILPCPLPRRNTAAPKLHDVSAWIVLVGNFQCSLQLVLQVLVAKVQLPVELELFGFRLHGCPVPRACG